MGSISSFSSLVTMFLVNISIPGIKQQMGIKNVGARMCGRGKDCQIMKGNAVFRENSLCGGRGGQDKIKDRN